MKSCSVNFVNTMSEQSSKPIKNNGKKKKVIIFTKKKKQKDSEEVIISKLQTQYDNVSLGV